MLLLLMLLPHKTWALLPLLLLLQPEPATASLPVAPDLVSYVASLTLVINDFYDDKISGVEFDVDTLVCTDLGFETLSWSNDGPGVASVRVRGVSATCSGEYDWKYKTGLGTLRGDGELQAAVEGSNLVIQVEGDVGSGGLFETVTVVGCEANVALDGVEPCSNLQLDFNVRVCDGFDANSLAWLRELDESNRFVQKSAESTSI